VKIRHIVIGMTALGLGIYGVYDEYFVVIEFLKGVIQPVAFLIGLIAILAGLLARKVKLGHVIIGVGLVALGIYGFYDEYYATLDFFKGAVPPLLLILGTVSVVAGVKQLG